MQLCLPGNATSHVSAVTTYHTCAATATATERVAVLAEQTPQALTLCPALLSRCVRA